MDIYMKRLYINLPKTFLNFVFFSKIKSSNIFKFSLDCHLINQTDSIKFWGVFLDSRQLKLSLQINILLIQSISQSAIGYLEI